MHEINDKTHGESRIFILTKNISVKMKKFVFLGLFFPFLLSIQCKTLENGENSHWINVNGGDIWYSIGSLPMNYSEAYDYCQREGGMLAEPRDSSQTENINSLLDSSHGYWIGLTDVMTEALFVWNSDGQNTESYRNWYGPVEPNNSGDCVQLYNFHNFQWDDCNCHYEDNLFALCQKST